ncbi:hypothetical protein KDI_21570 [Dictyobacter arantiisoli]|uniref:Uncharacterized protein n=1 Tax=Dictyobacter arantiisoli TaxID=2014874 RepID=A0A5A5TC38_9CHLR|nr:hypothetical protein KDI_21570 [Dictyobacter arantiisoli]
MGMLFYLILNMFNKINIYVHLSIGNLHTLKRRDTRERNPFSLIGTFNTITTSKTTHPRSNAAHLSYSINTKQ